MPVNAATMNYACVMTGGITVLLTLWYLWKRRHGYVGPQVALEASDNILVGVAGLTKGEEEARRRQSVR
jgi:choline transport protein